MVDIPSPLSGIRPGIEAQNEIDRLFAVLEVVRGLRQSAAEAETLADFSAGALTGKIARLERSCQRMLERLVPTSTPAALSKPPGRGAATRGIDTIALELQRSGLTFRQARQVVWAVRDSWKEALAKGESVETPWGHLSARKTRSGRRRFIFSGLPFAAR